MLARMLVLEVGEMTYWVGIDNDLLLGCHDGFSWSWYFPSRMIV